VLLAFVVLRLVFFGTKPRDWLRRTSPKWLTLCWEGCKSLIQSIVSGKFVVFIRLMFYAVFYWQHVPLSIAFLVFFSNGLW